MNAQPDARRFQVCTFRSDTRVLLAITGVPGRTRIQRNQTARDGAATVRYFLQTSWATARVRPASGLPPHDCAGRNADGR